MTKCTGKGVGGDHCCYIAGRVCVFYDNGCSLLVELGTWEKVHTDIRWKSAPVAQYFADHYPGFGCGDWPQNIPEVMSKQLGAFHLCCWSD